jgi:hypothetical protein
MKTYQTLSQFKQNKLKTLQDNATDNAFTLSMLALILAVAIAIIAK